MADHPGLFRATGFAHHPYRFDAAPQQPDPEPDNAPLAEVARLHRTLDAVYRRWHARRLTPVWFTEYGYKTRPPDPFAGVSWGEQASYLSEANFVAFRDPLVVSMAQFLLADDAPRAQFAARDKRRWQTFQTGLFTTDDRPKTAVTAYERSFWVEPALARRGSWATVFGQYRPAAEGTRIAARLQFLARGSRTWTGVRTLLSTNQRGFFSSRIRLPAAGAYRLAYTNPANGREEDSLPARVRIDVPKLPDRSKR